MPKISVIIPVYNTSQYLKRCLNSVVNQTLKDIEIICINDYSKDNSLEILQNYSKKDSRIKIINFEKNKGVSVARNTGIEEAKGEYVAFLDSDDELMLDCYEKLYNKVQNNEDLIFGNAIVKTKNTENITNCHKLIFENNNRLYFNNYHTATIYKRECLIKNNIRFFTNICYAEDLLFINTILMYAKTFSYAHDSYYIYHRREDSTDSKRLSDEKIDSGLFVFNKLLDNFNSIPEIVNNKHGYEYYFNEMFFNCIAFTFKNNNKSKRKDCAKTLINLYNKMIHKDLLIKNLKKKHSLIEYYLDTHENNKFIDIITSTTSFQEFLIKNLRFNVKKDMQ